LGEESKRDQNNDAVAIPWCPEEFSLAVTFEFLLKFDGLLNLMVFELNDLVILVTTGVNAGQYSQRFVISAFGYQPSRGFGDFPDENELQN
jgi:hypothetical protein